MKAHAIYDLDGTLLDSFEMHYISFKEVMDGRGVDFSRSFFKKQFGNFASEILNQYSKEHRLGLDEVDIEEIVREKHKIFREKNYLGVKAFEDVVDRLDELRAEGVVVSVASNTPRKNIDLMLAASGLKGAFDIVVSPEDVRKPKPEPDMLDLAAKKSGVDKASTVFLDDSIHGLVAAHRAGIKSVGVLSGGATLEQLEDAGADMILEGAWLMDAGCLGKLVNL